MFYFSHCLKSRSHSTKAIFFQVACLASQVFAAQADESEAVGAELRHHEHEHEHDMHHLPLAPGFNQQRKGTLGKLVLGGLGFAAGHYLANKYAQKHRPGYNQGYNQPGYNQGYNLQHQGYPYQQYPPHYGPQYGYPSQYGYSSQNAYSPQNGYYSSYKPQIGYSSSYQPRNDARFGVLHGWNIPPSQLHSQPPALRTLGDSTGGIEHYIPGALSPVEIYCYYNFCDFPDIVYPEH